MDTDPTRHPQRFQLGSNIQSIVRDAVNFDKLLVFDFEAIGEP
jgi:hypothetical protein